MWWITSKPASNFTYTGVGLDEFDCNGCDLIAVSPATAIPTTVGIENNNGIDNDVLLLNIINTSDAAIDSLVKSFCFDPIGIGVRDFNY